MLTFCLDMDLRQPNNSAYEALQGHTSLHSASSGVSSPPANHPNGEAHSAAYDYRHHSHGPYIDAAARRTSKAGFNSPSWSDLGAAHLKRQCCTYPGCGKFFKDLKAHMQSHLNERPEKCPIGTCEYHMKGFARKYDRIRHTLMHYKGTMVCGFCPGIDTAAETTFNRPDLFKKHLVTDHGVQPPPSNSHKTASTTVSGNDPPNSPAAVGGRCSICSQSFVDAGEFYNHLDDCVLSAVQQVDPTEDINAQHLAEVGDDFYTYASPRTADLPFAMEISALDDDIDVGFKIEDDEDTSSLEGASAPLSTTGKSGGSRLPQGLLLRDEAATGSKSRRRRNKGGYPSSWGFDQGQMTVKKRIMAVFDGTVRVGQGDMVLSTDHEVRVRLSDGKSYVTDLDVQMLDRAERFYNDNDDGGGVSDVNDVPIEQIEELHAMLEDPTIPNV